MTTASYTNIDPVIERHDAFISPNYPRYGVVMARGEGCRVWDSEGNEYLDLFAGFGGPILGHCHPDLVEAVTVQAQRLWHVGNLFHTEPQTHAAEAIARHGFGGLSFFCHAGADANEAAIKLARLHGKAHPGPEGPRYKIISTTRSFHGRSFGTMGATGNAKVREGFEPMLPGFVNVAYDDLRAVERECDPTAVAIIAEPIQGEGGVNVPDDDYLPALRRLCDEKNMLLIVDEIWTGCGRTGRYFAHQHSGVTPDVMTLGKGVGGGLAVGVMCCKSALGELVDPKTQGTVKHATTLGGNCLSMAVTAKIFEVLERDGLVEHADALGQAALDRLRSASDSVPAIREVRGRGLFLGIELDLEQLPFEKVGQVVDACRERGVLVGSAGDNVLRLAPPLVISRDDWHRGLEIVEGVLRG